MTPERWQQVSKILEELLERDASAGDDYLDVACAEDDGLRREVEELLVHAKTGDLLDRPVVDHPPTLPDDAAMTSSVPTGVLDEVRPIELAPYTRVDVRTQSALYELTVVAPLELELLVKGGNRFPQSARAYLYGQDSIRVGVPLQMLVGTRKIVTSAVEAIEVLD